jgi:hypothetical protein
VGGEGIGITRRRIRYRREESQRGWDPRGAGEGSAGDGRVYRNWRGGTLCGDPVLRSAVCVSAIGRRGEEEEGYACSYLLPCPSPIRGEIVWRCAIADCESE